MSLSYSNISCLMHLMVFTHVTFCIAKTSLYITNMLNVLKLNVKSQKDQYIVVCNSFVYHESALWKNYHIHFELQVRYGLHWTSRNQNEICLPPPSMPPIFITIQ